MLLVPGNQFRPKYRDYICIVLYKINDDHYRVRYVYDDPRRGPGSTMIWNTDSPPSIELINLPIEDGAITYA